MYPMKLIPVLKDIVWGGTRLYSEYGKGDVTNKKIAESWELAIHKNGMNIVENGDFAGISFEEVFDVSNGEIVMQDYKTKSRTPDKFPVLIKFIDAEQDLSVQVHPDNEYAMEHENELGKTEMWYIIDAVPGSKIVYGLKNSFTREQLESALADSGRFVDCLEYIDVKAGDVYFIPAGLIHAIGKGILIAEVQQNSDTTYRVYDYDRLVEGKKRDLHIKKALDVCIKNNTDVSREIIRNTDTGINAGYSVELLASCQYFTAKKYNISAEYESEVKLTAEKTSFNSIICLDGSAKIIFDGAEYNLRKGDSYFIPAGLGEYKISGSCVFLFVALD